MTVATSVLSKVYPVVGGAAALLASRGALEVGKNIAVGGGPSSGGTNTTPSGRSSGGTAWWWTALSWAVSVGVGIYTGKKLVRHPSPGVTARELQPAQS